jgi:hypothetical protein
MAATRRAAWAQGLDSDQIGFYEGLDPAQWICRGRRRHRFHLDEQLPVGNLPDGVQVVKVTGGWEIRDNCERGCGRALVYYTDNRGAIDWGSRHYAGGGKRYHATGLGLTAADDRRYFEHQQGEQLADRIRLFVKRASGRVTVAS